MDSKSNPLVNLACLMKQGKDGSEQSFSQAMGPQLERIVRRVIRFGPGRSVLEQKIEREVELTAGNPRDPAGDRETIVALVTRRLLREMVERIRSDDGPAHPGFDTAAVSPPRDAPTRLEWGAALAPV